MLFGARLLQKTAMLVTSAEREVEPSMKDKVTAHFLLLFSFIAAH